MKNRIMCIFYTMRLRYLINHVAPSKKVNQEIFKLHLKLNELEKQKGLL